MYRITLYVIVGYLALAPVECQNAITQKKLYGTVDGRPIPDRVFED